ncbi:hypothetical protein CA850_09275 [Micromonospora echinospora]|nr:hypothetical protein CA850_09275 [Micromonospora echinospora]
MGRGPAALASAGRPAGVRETGATGSPVVPRPTRTRHEEVTMAKKARKKKARKKSSANHGKRPNA